LYKLSSDYFIYLSLYIDDLLIAARDKYDIHNLKAWSGTEFEINNLRATKKILGRKFSEIKIGENSKKATSRRCEIILA